MFLNKNFLKSITKCLVIILLINTCVETKSLNAAAYSCDSSNPPSNCNLSDLFYYMSGATPSNHNVVHDNILFEGHIPSLSSFQSNYCRYMTEKRSDGSGITSLMSAASRGLTNAAQALVNCNANLNDQDTKHDKRAIDYAKQNGHDDIVAILKDTERFPLNHSCIYDLDCDNTGNNAGVSCGDSSLCCMPNGKACSDTGDCCDGSCNNGICCDAVGKSCQSSVECCNQNCQNGRCCISSAAGQPKCTSSADCCSGLSCDSDTGICADPSSCIAKGATCIPGDLSRAKKVNATSSCCGGLVCKPNNIYSGATLDSTDTCCVDLGVTCNISADCCGQSACQGSACCIPTGQNGCENDNDCCSGNTCQDKGPGHPKQCKLNCKPKDAVCTGDTECCTPMTCNLDPTDNTNTRKICGTKSGCVDNGTVCNLDSDCCKGLCNADPKDSTAKSCQCINDSTTTCNANNCCYGKTCATSNDGKTNNVCCISSANDTKCTDSSDCCSGLTCQAGKCTTGGGDSGGLSGLAIGGIITAACLFVAGAGIYFVFFRKGKKVTSKEPLTERLIVQAAADANMSVDDFVSKLRSGFGQAEFVAISGAIRSYGNADNPDEWVRELITAVLESAPGKIVNLGGSRTSMTIKVTVAGEEGGSGGARLTVRNSVLDKVATNWREIIKKGPGQVAIIVPGAGPVVPPSGPSVTGPLDPAGKLALSTFIRNTWTPSEVIDVRTYTSWRDFVDANPIAAREIVGMARMVVGPDASDTDLRGAIRNILKSKVELDSGYARATKNDDGGSPYAVFSNKGTTSYIGGRNSTSNVRNFNREEFNEFKSRAFDLIGKTYDSGTNYSPTVRAQAYEAFMQEQAWREAAGVPREYDPVE